MNYTLVKFTKTHLILKNKNNNELKLNYKNCILCCGGLETPRILLESNIININIGKYYSPHLSTHYGRCVLDKNIIKNRSYHHKRGLQYLLHTYNNLKTRIVIEDSLDIICQSDQIPNKDSGIQLMNDLDNLGCKKIILTHKAFDDDFKRLIKCYEDLDKDLKNNNIGYVSQIPTINELKDLTCGASHHLGMTRFGTDKEDGVVDNNCKVFDTDNIYILSTSVFPSYSHAQPTFTLIGLIYYFLDKNLIH